MMLDQTDQTLVAQMAAKAANMAVAGHEDAKHDEASVQVQTVVNTGQGQSAPHANFVQDGNGNDSSKRLQSFIGLGLAAVIAVLGLILVPTQLVAVGAVAGGFLTYSLAMQGVSAASERGMLR